MYPIYRNRRLQRDPVSSPLTIALTSTYDSIANTGTVNATITNTSVATVSGTLQFAITEDSIPCNWYGLSTVEHVCRQFLPNANGDTITITAGNNVLRSRNFTVSAGWNEKKIKIICFVQGADKSIYQGAQIGIFPKPKMSYWGLTFVETSGNVNRIAQPGETIRLYLYGKNNGNSFYNGSATLTTSDAYATINSQTPQTVSIGQAKVDTVIIANVSISASCPTPRAIPFRINFGTPGDTLTFNFIITNQPGFSDNMESGTSKWTHFGLNDSFHLSTWRNHSATRSWYCGRDANHQYINEQDASLVSNWFVATPDSALRFWHYYATEVNYDYAYFEIDNGSGWWRHLSQFNGNQTSWVQASYNMNAYAGQTIRMRFRWISDPATIAEGWYIDDVLVPVVIIGVDENNIGKTAAVLSIAPNPFRSSTRIALNLGQRAPGLGLKIYDASGRLIKDLTSTIAQPASAVTWDGTDLSGDKVASGIYIVQLETDGKKLTEKVLLLK